MNKRRTGCAAAGILLAACGTQGSTASGPAAVTIEDFEYRPAELTVPIGTAVTWTNRDDFGHTVTSGTPADAGKTFDGRLGDTIDGKGKQFTDTFGEPGTYEYFCDFHTSMRGTVRVQAS